MTHDPTPSPLDLPARLALTEVERAEEIDFIQHLIESAASNRASFQRHLRRARSNESKGDWLHQIERATEQIANLQTTLVALTTAADVEYVRISGLTLKGVPCRNCGEPIENGWTPVRIHRRGGVYELSCAICYDQKYTHAIPAKSKIIAANETT